MLVFYSGWGYLVYDLDIEMTPQYHSGAMSTDMAERP